MGKIIVKLSFKTKNALVNYQSAFLINGLIFMSLHYLRDNVDLPTNLFS